MPLIIEENLPAAKILNQENVFIMGKSRAEQQDIRPIKLAIVNLMPNKEETELQLFRVLSNTALQVEIDLVYTKSYQPKHTEKNYLDRFYQDFSSIKNSRYDGLIITGAPVERLEFEEVLYWQELEDIFEFARSNVYSTMCICWAAQAGLYYYYDIPKYVLKDKIFGVYEYQLHSDSLLTKGFDDLYYFPQSRYSFTDEKDIRKVADLKIISSHKDTGPNIVASQDYRFVFVSGHGEYSRETLYHEYLRDLKEGLSTPVPQNYFYNDQLEQGIVMKWRSSGSLFFTNWLNYCVYQQTPYDLRKLEGKKTLKFGGSSLSDSKQFRKVKEIIESDQERNLVVVSAPGKRHEKDSKVTDLLIAYCQSSSNAEKENLLGAIEGRYFGIISELGISESLFSFVQGVLDEIRYSQQRDFILSRGEFLSAKVMAEFLNFEFIDAQDLIFFDHLGKLDQEKSLAAIKDKLSLGQKWVIPGFYGTAHDGQIKVFDRGGSDITGSLVASAMQAAVYENWTDVDGLMNKDPNLHDDARLISQLSYGDFLKVSLHGDQVYHLDAIKAVMESEIPINIRNTNNPFSAGTMITNSREDY